MTIEQLIEMYQARHEKAIEELKEGTFERYVIQGEIMTLNNVIFELPIYLTVSIGPLTGKLSRIIFKGLRDEENYIFNSRYCRRRVFYKPFYKRKGNRNR